MLRTPLAAVACACAGALVACGGDADPASSERRREDGEWRIANLPGR